MKYDVINYPDGAHYVRVTDFENPTLEFKLNSYNDLWILAQIKDVCDHNDVEVDLVIPCLLDAQADRRFSPNESSNLALVCRFLSILRFKSITIFHPHNPEAVEALLPRVKIVDNSFFITKVLEDLSIDYKNELLLMSADAGGFKPLVKLANVIKWEGNTYSASKSRDPKTHALTQQIGETDFQGKDILIIDDICVYGGTFIGLSKLLKERNAGKLYLAVSHLTMPRIKQGLEDAFDCIYVTDSKYDRYAGERSHGPIDLTNTVKFKVFSWK